MGAGVVGGWVVGAGVVGAWVGAAVAGAEVAESWKFLFINAVVFTYLASSGT